MDSSYLFEALADHLGLLRRQKEKVNVSKTTPATLTATKIESPESVTLKNEENINAMKIIFPDYGAGFLEACLLVSRTDRHTYIHTYTCILRTYMHTHTYIHTCRRVDRWTDTRPVMIVVSHYFDCLIHTSDSVLHAASIRSKWNCQTVRNSW